MAGYKPRWFASLQMLTHLSTDWARHGVSSLIKTSALPLSQATTVGGLVEVLFRSSGVRSSVLLSNTALRKSTHEYWNGGVYDVGRHHKFTFSNRQTIEETTAF